VAVLVQAEQPAGTYTRVFEAGGLGSGVYLLRLEAAGQHLVEPLVVAR
jgi:hypothetical protein